MKSFKNRQTGIRVQPNIYSDYKFSCQMSRVFQSDLQSNSLNKKKIQVSFKTWHYRISKKIFEPNERIKRRNKLVAVQWSAIPIPFLVISIGQKISLIDSMIELKYIFFVAIVSDTNKLLEDETLVVKVGRKLLEKLAIICHFNMRIA